MARIIRFPGAMNVPSGTPNLLAAQIADDFARGNSSTLGTTPIGGKAWVDATGVAIINEKLDMSSVTTTSNVRFASGWTNYEIEGKLAAIGSTGATTGGGILVRYASGTDYYWLSTRVSPSQNGVQFWRVSTGGVTEQAGTGTLMNLKAGDLLRVVAQGPLLLGYVNGVLVAQVTGVTNTAGTVGFIAHATGTATKWEWMQARQR